MSTVKVQGNASGTGSITLASPNTNSDRTQTLPDGTGTVVVNGVNGALVSGTAVASTSGTSIDFTGIPSWVKRITVMFSGVSTTGTGVRVQLGTSSGVTTSGYLTFTGGIAAASAAGATSTSGFDATVAATTTLYGSIVFVNQTSNSWVGNGALYRNGDTVAVYPVGGITLSGTLDRVRITTVNGTDTFDAGSINILYE